MSTLSKRSTVYFEPAIHQALQFRSASTDVSIWVLNFIKIGHGPAVYNRC